MKRPEKFKDRKKNNPSKRAKKYFEKCLSSITIREMYIKTILTFHFTPVKMSKINKQWTIDAGEVVE